jgi:hypothetical protein
MSRSLPGLHKQGIPAGLRLRRVQLRRLTVLYPLDRFAEGIAGLLGLADVADQLLLELVAVLHVRSRPQLQDELRYRLLGSLMPRMSKHVFGRESLAEQPHATRIAPATPDSECIAPPILRDAGGSLSVILGNSEPATVSRCHGPGGVTVPKLAWPATFVIGLTCAGFSATTARAVTAAHCRLPQPARPSEPAPNRAICVIANLEGRRLAPIRIGRRGACDRPCSYPSLSVTITAGLSDHRKSAIEPTCGLVNPLHPPIQRPAIAFMRGVRTLQSTVRMSASARTASNVAVKFEPRSRT